MRRSLGEPVSIPFYHVAEHACLLSSERVGRSAAGKALEDEAVRAAVVAHVRHASTDYDVLLARGYERRAARIQVAAAIEQVLDRWAGPAD